MICLDLEVEPLSLLFARAPRSAQLNCCLSLSLSLGPFCFSSRAQRRLYSSLSSSSSLCSCFSRFLFCAVLFHLGTFALFALVPRIDCGVKASRERRREYILSRCTFLSCRAFFSSPLVARLLFLLHVLFFLPLSLSTFLFYSPFDRPLLFFETPCYAALFCFPLFFISPAQSFILYLGACVPSLRISLSLYYSPLPALPALPFWRLI